MATQETSPYSSADYGRVREQNRIRRDLALTVAATALAATTFGIINGNFEKIQEKPSPTEFVPRLTEIDPLTPIEKVPLQTQGLIKLTYLNSEKPNEYLLEVENATVVAINHDSKGKIKEFAVTVAGDEVKRECANNTIKNNSCSYSGVTLWFSLGDNTVVTESIGNVAQIAGRGPEAINGSIKRGNVIRYIGIGTSYLEGSRFGNLESVAKNLHSLNNLNEKVEVEQKMVRTDQSLFFIPGNINI